MLSYRSYRQYRELSHALRRRKGRLRLSELPAPVLRDLQRQLREIARALPLSLNREIQRCFGSEIPLLARTPGSGRVSLTIRQEHPNLVFQLAKYGDRFRLMGFHAKLRGEEISPVTSEDELYSGQNWVLSGLFKDIFSSSSYYLPAARSGILQGHKLLASVILRKLPLAGIEALNVPQLSGIVADFISNILSLAPRTHSKSVAAISDFLESRICKGSIDRKAGGPKEGFPEIYYTVGKNEIPLHRTSSMVSEIAPIVLFLRYLVRERDLLIIEEPEAHLHPDNQRILANAIVKLIRAGVQIVITTHSDYFVQQLSNFVRLGKAPRQRAALGYSRDDYLSAEEVGAYLFKTAGRRGGSTVQELRVTDGEGIPEDEFVTIAEEIYDESVRLQRALAP